MKNFLFGRFLLILFLSCIIFPKANAQSQTITLDISKFDKSILFSDIVSDIKYIPLETNEDCYLNSPTQILFDDSLIFFQDREHDEIFVFYLSGQFLNKVGVRGRGPNEILQYGDFHLDKTHDRIEIHDQGSNSLLVHDYKGKFISKSKLPWAVSFDKTDKGDYLLYSGYPVRFLDSESKPLDSPIILLNEKGQITNTFNSEFKPFGQRAIGIHSNTAISSYKDTLIFCPNRSNIIYHFIDNHLQPRFILDFGRRNLPEKYYELKDLHSSQFKEWQSDYVLEVYDYCETDDCCIFHFPYNMDSYQCVVDKGNFDVKIARRKDYTNDIDKIKPKYFTFKSTCNNYLVSYIQSLDFQKQVKKILSGLTKEEKEEYVSNFPAVIDIYNKATENDNPIIILYTYKKTGPQ